MKRVIITYTCDDYYGADDGDNDGDDAGDDDDDDGDDEEGDDDDDDDDDDAKWPVPASDRPRTEGRLKG